MSSVLPVNLPPREAVAFFRRKKLTPSFDWRDVYGDEHARAFVVAKVMQLDVLTEIAAAVDAAISDGVTPEQFRRELRPKLIAKGWWGRGKMIDPATGEEEEVQLGSVRRLNIIYDTNLRTSLAAGQWERIQRVKKRRPYLRYVHQPNNNPRHQHQAWHGLVLPVDDPFWLTHFPPNGWHCHCSVQQLSERDLERYGYAVAERSPTPITDPWTNPRTGEIRHIPRGIDPGFDNNPGHAGEHAARLFGERLASSPADVGAAVWKEAGEGLAGPLQNGFARWASNVTDSSEDAYPVGGISPDVVAGLRARGVSPRSAGIVARGRDVARMLAGAEQLALFDGDPAEAVRKLPAHMAAARAVLWDRRAGSLAFVLDAPRRSAAAELVVRVAVQVGKGKATANRVAGAELAAADALTDPAAYDVLAGAL